MAIISDHEGSDTNVSDTNVSDTNVSDTSLPRNNQDTRTTRNPTPCHHVYETLPIPGTERAPQTYTGDPNELETFLDHFRWICKRYRVKRTKEKYKALFSYCHPKMQNMLRNLPSAAQQDMDLLIEELRYFYGITEVSYSVGAVEAFTAKWRKRPVTKLAGFKRYHRKYLELIGDARENKRISDWDYHRYFWEGLEESFRQRLENRMMTTHPHLDISLPFGIDRIVKAAEYLLSATRFDQHLITRTSQRSSDTDSDHKPKVVKHKIRHDTSSDDSDHYQKPLTRPYPRPSRHRDKKSRQKEPSHQDAHHKPKESKKEDDELQKLVDQMGQMNISPDKYTSLYIEIVRRDPTLKEHLIDPRTRFAGATFQVRPPVSQTQNNQPQNNQPRYDQRQSNRPPFRRDEPPHRNLNPNPQPSQPVQSQPDGREIFCWGCGLKGHPMSNCDEMNMYYKAGTVIKEPNTGMPTWPDGRRIYRDNNEPWGIAISKTVKKVNQVYRVHTSRDPDSVQRYIGVPREEDDASTEDQEELGWTSGLVGDRQAFGVERTERVSKETRKKVQDNPPNLPHRVKKFPRSRDADRPSRKNPPIQDHVDLDRNQARLPKRLTPVDVNKDIFEGKADKEFLPMTVDQPVTTHLGNDPRKETSKQPRPRVPKVSNPGTATGKDSSAIAQEILNTPLTLSLREVVGVSPSLRRELSTAVKQVREAPSQPSEKMGLAGELLSDPEMVTCCKVELPEEDGFIPEQPEEGEVIPPYKKKRRRRSIIYEPAVVDAAQIQPPQDSLLKMEAQVGNASMTSLFDSGSQINLISQKKAIEAGLPWSTKQEHRPKMISVDGTVSKCAGKVRRAVIGMTDKKLPTKGNLYVKAASGFDLLLGRPWGRKNRAHLLEKQDGSHITFRSETPRYGKGRYGVNVCPTPHPYRRSKKDFTEDSDFTTTSDSTAIDDFSEDLDGYTDYGDAYYTNPDPHSQVLAASIEEIGDDEEIVPETNEESSDRFAINAEEMEADTIGETEERIENLPDEIYSEFPTPAQRRYEVEDEVFDLGDESEDDREEDAARRAKRGEKSRDFPCAARNSHEEDIGETQESKTEAEPKEFEIDSSLHDNYIKMVQKGISNDEWNLFCRQEERRKARDDKRWNLWKRADANVETEANETSDSEGEGFNIPETPSEPRESPEPSHTLRTPSSTVPRKRKREWTPEHRSEITAARRSQRMRRKTERAMGDEYKRYMRTYQRQDKQARKTVRSKKAPVIESDFCVFAAQVLPPSPDSENPDENPDFATGNPGNREIKPGMDNVSPDDPNDPEFERFGLDNAEETLTDPPARDHFDRNDAEGSAAPIKTGAPDNQINLIGEGVKDPEEKTEVNQLTRDKEQRIHSRTDNPEKKPVIAAVSDPTDLRIEELSMLSCDRKEPTTRNDNGIPLLIGTAGKTPNAEADQNCLSETDPLTKADKPIEGNGINTSPPETKNERMAGDEKVQRWIEAWEREKEETAHQIKILSKGNRFDGEEPEGTDSTPDLSDQRREDDRREALDLVYPRDKDNDYHWGNEESVVPYNRKFKKIEYVPPPLQETNGLLGAHHIHLQAQDTDAREYYFWGRDLTLVIEGPDGEITSYFGEATIQLQQPDPSETIRIPPLLGRTNEMRERLFKRGKFAKKKTTAKLAVPELTRKGVRNDTNLGVTLTPNELEAIGDALINQPMKFKERPRTYTIVKTRDGRVIVELETDPEVERTPPTDGEKKDLKEDEERDVSKDAEANETYKSKHTRFGSDPPTSDQTPALGASWERSGTFHEHMEPAKPMGYLERGPDEGSPSGESLKESELSEKYKNQGTTTYQDHQPSPEHEPPARISPTTASKPSSESPLAPLDDQELRTSAQTIVEPMNQTDIPLTLPMADIRTGPATARQVPVADSAQRGEGNRVPSPPHTKLSRGILTAEHVSRICPRHTEPLPPGDSFYAFNVTFVVAGRDEAPASSRQRHAYIRLFDSNYDEEESPPRPPTDDQEMSVNVVMVERNPLEGLDEFGRARRPTVDGTEVLRSIRLDPKAPEFVPSEGHYHVLDGDGRAVQWEKVLEELRGMRDETRMDEEEGTHLESLEPTLNLKNLPDVPHIDNHSTTPPTLLYPIEEEGEVRESVNLPDLATDDEMKDTIPGDEDDVMRIVAFCPCGCGESVEVKLGEVKGRTEGGAKKRPEGKVEEMKRRLEALAKNMEGLAMDGEQTLYDMFAELGLLQICFDLGEAQKSGKEVRKEEWIGRIVEALRGKNEETKERALSKLFAYEDRVKAEFFKYAPPDIQPGPRNPSPSFEWIPDVDVPPYVPRTPEPDERTEPYVPRSPDKAIAAAQKI
jgi:hypothetical protein